MGKTAGLIHVVDDDQGFRKTLERLLNAHGLKTRTFASAEEFEARADPFEANCLILDINLGGMSGIDLRYRLAGLACNVPVIFVTASDSDATRQAAFDAGCAALLQKPFQRHELLAALNKTLIQ